MCLDCVDPNLIVGADRQAVASRFEKDEDTSIKEFLENLPWTETQIKDSEIGTRFEEIKEMLDTAMKKNSHRHKINAFGTLRCIMAYGEQPRESILLNMFKDLEFEAIFVEGARQALKNICSHEIDLYGNFLRAMVEVSTESSLCLAYR